MFKDNPFMKNSEEDIVSAEAKFVPEQLRKAAAIYEERNALYGDVYKDFGKIMIVLFPDGISATSAEDPVSGCNRLGIIVQIVGKLMRYCSTFNAGGHADSLDDLAVYAMMLQELDQEAKIEITYRTGTQNIDEHRQSFVEREA